MVDATGLLADKSGGALLLKKIGRQILAFVYTVWPLHHLYLDKQPLSCGIFATCSYTPYSIMVKDDLMVSIICVNCFNGRETRPFFF